MLEVFRRDQRGTLAYYDFQWDPNDKRDSENHELLRNKAKTAAGIFGRHYDGQLWGSINMGMIEGRFPGKHALKFDWLGAGVKINIPVKCKQMTLAAWVKIEQMARPSQAILASDGWNQWPGQMQWFIRRGGAMVLAVDATGKRTAESAPSAFEPDRLGRWCLLAAVYDAAAGTISMYLDGQLIAQQAIATKDSVPILLGPAWIGCWDHQDVPPADDRTFEGCMDELMIFSTALSAEDIHRLFRDGLGVDSGSESHGTPETHHTDQQPTTQD